MSVSYRIYSNKGTGGPVDYSNPLATVSSRSYSVGPLMPASDYTFAVRSTDTISQLEEANTDATIRILTDSQSNNISSKPNAVQTISLVQAVGGGGRVSWSFIPAGLANRPTEFLIELRSATNTVSSVTVPYIAGAIGYTWDFAGPLALSTYTATVWSIGNSGLSSTPLAVSKSLGLTPTPFLLDSLTIR